MFEAITTNKNEFMAAVKEVSKRQNAFDKLMCLAMSRGYSINPHNANISSLVAQIEAYEKELPKTVRWKADIFSY